MYVYVYSLGQESLNKTVYEFSFQMNSQISESVMDSSVEGERTRKRRLNPHDAAIEKKHWSWWIP